MDFISQFAVSLDAILGEGTDTILFHDVHTHKGQVQDGEVAIINCYPGESYIKEKNISIGLHPWHVNENWKKQTDILRSEASKPNVLAIGECGLDKCVTGNFRWQIDAFKEQIRIAEELELPMIIHCVKAFDELFAIHKTMRPHQKWLIHGFRGKPEQARQLMAKGLLLSFGHHYNVNSLVYVASTCRSLFLETDDCDLSIHQIYEQVCHHLSSLRN